MLESVCKVKWGTSLPVSIYWSIHPSIQSLFLDHSCMRVYQFSSVTQSCLTLRPHELQHARPPCPSPAPRVYPNSCPSSWWCHLILCCPFLLLPPIPSSIRIFSSESTLHMRWPKYWSFSFSISPSKEPPGLISFRMDWLDLLTVQGTLMSLLQHQNLFTSKNRLTHYKTNLWLEKR